MARMFQDPTFESFMSETNFVMKSIRENQEILVYGVHKYACKKSKWKCQSRAYENRWYCSDETCQGAATTLKYLSDRQDRSKLKSEMNIYKAYENFNFQIVKPHNCSTGIPLDVLGAAKFDADTKDYIGNIPARDLDNLLPTSTIIENRALAYSNSGDPLKEAAILRYNILDKRHVVTAAKRRKKNSVSAVLPYSSDHLSINTAQFDDIYKQREKLPKELILLYSGRKFITRRVNGVRTVEEHTMLIYGSEQLLRLLFADERIFVDGTFKICPEHHFLSSLAVDAEVKPL
jgi:hypothetical protein